MDYRFEILKILYENKFKEVDLRPQIMEWIENGNSRGLIGDALNKLRDRHFILYSTPVSLTTLMAGVYKDDHVPIRVTLRGEGAEEYLRLDKIYNPPDQQPQLSVSGDYYGPQSKVSHGPNSPIAEHDVNQTINHEPKATVKKEWWERALDWLWEQIKKPVVAAISSFLIGFISGRTTSATDKEHSQSSSQLPSQPTNTQTSIDSTRSQQKDTFQNR